MNEYLIVNNGSAEPTSLERVFPDAVVRKWDDLQHINLLHNRLIILSGSSGFPVQGNEHTLRDEFDLVRRCPVPIIGICYGFEIIVAAFGGTLIQLPEKEKGIRELEILQPDPLFNGIETLTVYEGHRWVAEQVPKPLIPLAKSAQGIEVVRHATHPLYGVQFHPEKHLDETVGAQIIANIQTIFSMQKC